MNILFVALLAATLGAPLDNSIVTTAWLEQNLSSPDIVLVEIGPAGGSDYPHIPTARFVPFESLVVRDGWPPDELPSVAELKKTLQNAGIGNEGRIVIYSRTPLYATRAWFTLDYLGHGDRTAILDGGWAKWNRERRPVTTLRLHRLAKTFTPIPEPSRVVSLDEVRKAAASGTVLIDARPTRQFLGSRRGRSVIRPGHIPDAECLPWDTNLTRRGEFRPFDQLRTTYASLGATPGKRLIVYCRTGIEASMPYFLLRTLGYDVRLFDGSYAEWARDVSAPVETGAGR